MHLCASFVNATKYKDKLVYVVHAEFVLDSIMD
jgi:hypothetical protein